METPLIYPADLAERLKPKAGEKYRPSNGTEGDFFICAFCNRCQNNVNDNCRILFSTLIYDLEDPLYPEQWQYGEDGQPVCTAFEREVTNASYL